MRKKEFITKSSTETVKLGAKLGKELKKGDCIFLIGELGSGKTTFVQGIAKGLGIRDRVLSPSFVLVREYPEKNFFHIDLYRIGKKDFINSGLNQYLNSENICAIEWAEKIKTVWPLKNIVIDLDMIDKQVRKIVIRKA